jgi:hypothetical protein
MDEKIKAHILILLLGVLIGASRYLANSLILWNTSVSMLSNLKQELDAAR